MLKAYTEQSNEHEDYIGHSAIKIILIIDSYSKAASML